MNTVLNRLNNGERLIAMTARGVSWDGGEEFPDPLELEECFKNGWVRRDNYVVWAGWATVPTVQIILTFNGLIAACEQNRIRCEKAFENPTSLVEEAIKMQEKQTFGSEDLVRPRIVCLCGSTRFSDAYQQANLHETLDGKIVLTIGCDMKSDAKLFEGWSAVGLDTIKHRLDELHLRKIDLADEILVIDVNDYIGESTAREIEYAQSHDKRIRYWSKEYFNIRKDLR